MKDVLKGTLLIISSLLLGVGIAYADRVPVNASVGLITSGNCNTASSTLFAVQSPSGATSTASIIRVSGTGTTTAMDILIGTSTSPYMSTGFSTSTLSENVLGVSAIASGAQFYSVAGQTIGPGTGYNSASGGPYVTRAQVVVGPTEYLKGISTSTAPTAGGAIPSACFYSIEWYQ